MNDIMYLDSIAVTACEKRVVKLIRQGRDDIPRDLFARNNYYQKLFDKYSTSVKMSQKFKRGFSLFVCASDDVMERLRKEGYHDKEA